MPMRLLEEKDYIEAANTLGCEVAAIKAIAEVESGPHSFVKLNGKYFPVILFERHKFYRYSGSKPYSKTHPHLSNRRAGGYTRGSLTTRQTGEWRKFAEAYELEPDAAIMSCSWGKFQVMGFNHRIVGYDTPEAMYRAFLEPDEAVHLRAFVQFIKNNRALHRALINRDWSKVAYYYNGSGYKRNKYDVKMARAYRKYR